MFRKIVVNLNIVALIAVVWVVVKNWNSLQKGILYQEQWILLVLLPTIVASLIYIQNNPPPSNQ